MKGLTWHKFYWSHWASDPALSLCGLAAQGLWMRMLCVAAENDPTGYVAINGRPLGVTDIARLAGVTETEAAELLEDLSRNGVFSRDRNGCIYSRRMVRDEKRRKLNKKLGKMGGNPSLCKDKGNPARVNPQDNRGDKPKSIEVREERKKVSSSASAPARDPVGVASPPPGPPGQAGELIFDTAARELSLDLAKFRQNALWLNFPAMVLEWKRQGAIDADIWPTIRQIMAKKGGLANSPAYYAAAVLEAKTKRLAETAAADEGRKRDENLPPDHPEWRSRLRTYRETGEWFWGPKPGEEGFLGPQQVAA